MCPQLRQECANSVHIVCKAEVHMMKRYSGSGEENIYFPVHHYCILSFAKLSVGATFAMQCISSFFFPRKVLCSSLYRKVYVLYWSWNEVTGRRGFFLFFSYIHCFAFILRMKVKLRSGWSVSLNLLPGEYNTFIAKHTNAMVALQRILSSLKFIAPPMIWETSGPELMSAHQRAGSIFSMKTLFEVLCLMVCISTDPWIACCYSRCVLSLQECNFTAI